MSGDYDEIMFDDGLSQKDDPIDDMEIDSKQNVRYTRYGVVIEADCSTCQDTHDIELEWKDIPVLRRHQTVPPLVRAKNGFAAQFVCETCSERMAKDGINREAKTVVYISDRDVAGYYQRYIGMGGKAVSAPSGAQVRAAQRKLQALAEKAARLRALAQKTPNKTTIAAAKRAIDQYTLAKSKLAQTLGADQ